MHRVKCYTRAVPCKSSRSLQLCRFRSQVKIEVHTHNRRKNVYEGAMKLGVMGRQEKGFECEREKDLAQCKHDLTTPPPDLDKDGIVIGIIWIVDPLFYSRHHVNEESLSLISQCLQDRLSQSICDHRNIV